LINHEWWAIPPEGFIPIPILQAKKSLSKAQKIRLIVDNIW
jgi:hypothetical protein